MKNLSVFILICFISWLSVWLLNQFVISDALYYNSFAEQLATEKIESIVAQSHKWTWLGYAFVPLIYLVKFSLIASVLLTGFFFIDFKVKYSLLLKAVMLAEMPFLLVPFIKLLWFLFVQTNYTFSDLQYFFPLSALQLFDAKALAPWQLYPLQLLNVFELVYWFLLAYWLKNLLGTSLSKSMEVVLSSYGTGLLLWVVFITFLSLNMS